MLLVGETIASLIYFFILCYLKAIFKDANLKGKLYLNTVIGPGVGGLWCIGFDGKRCFIRGGSMGLLMLLFGLSAMKVTFLKTDVER